MIFADTLILWPQTILGMALVVCRGVHRNEEAVGTEDELIPFLLYPNTPKNVAWEELGIYPSSFWMYFPTPRPQREQFSPKRRGIFPNG